VRRWITRHYHHRRAVADRAERLGIACHEPDVHPDHEHLHDDNPGRDDLIAEQRQQRRLGERSIDLRRRERKRRRQRAADDELDAEQHEHQRRRGAQLVLPAEPRRLLAITPPPARRQRRTDRPRGSPGR
jgi:hypothetical protein